jgi:hypothetical protein
VLVEVVMGRVSDPCNAVAGAVGRFSTSCENRTQSFGAPEKANLAQIKPPAVSGTRTRRATALSSYVLCCASL